jgi:hypothetical protein
MTYDYIPKLITDYLTFLPDNFQEISITYLSETRWNCFINNK